MAIVIARHICLVFISPPDELTSMLYFMIMIGRLCYVTNLDDMKECDAPNQTIFLHGVSRQGTYPIPNPGIAGLHRWSHD
jgi:hypothetical protein